MKDKVIEELHRIRERHYEETKDLSFEELAERINERGDAFQKLVEQAKQKKPLVEVSQPL
jgi:DNA-binding ferritin-like protein